jgi:hypothetical protein
MRILLDTHIFLWFISGDSRLSVDIRDAIRDTANEVYLSVVSVWSQLSSPSCANNLCQSHLNYICPNSAIYTKSSALRLMKEVLLNWLSYHYFIAILSIEC